MIRYSETLSVTRTAYELEKRGRQITDELHELDRRKWQMAEADLKRQIKGLKIQSKLMGSVGFVITGGLLIVIAVK
ncbi:hypothetical protein [Siphonobacter sp. SORGH_AS_1065]|uniref:hypothetical protein n=1 Tax=Siphonobacter sp. SORGH_AS_1065 TaxID=3041795 RepID=UPI002782E8F9|nr:hypothetical protein [Siphonobacter sp. SORGH_AS_1065]MDQ1088575.1 hypothetical protein [Siphonobacter sp. SORGH_AS_1065]